MDVHTHTHTQAQQERDDNVNFHTLFPADEQKIYKIFIDDAVVKYTEIHSTYSTLLTIWILNLYLILVQFLQHKLI